MSKGQPRLDAHGWNSRLLAAKLSRAATCGVEALVGLSSSSASILSSFDSTDATACCRKPPHPEFCFAGLRGDAILVSDSEGSQAKVEMAREVLWHEYPTDHRDTYFRQFWDVRGYAGPPGVQVSDISPIREWNVASAWGTHRPAARRQTIPSRQTLRRFRRYCRGRSVGPGGWKASAMRVLLLCISSLACGCATKYVLIRPWVEFRSETRQTFLSSTWPVQKLCIHG